jgi:putative ABC transport system permease protein
MAVRSRVPAALRALSHDAASTLLAVGLLGLALGTAAAAFSILHATVLAPLPFADQDRLALIWRTNLQVGVPVVEVSYRDTIDVGARSHTFTDLASFGSINWPLSLFESGPPTALKVAGVSGAFFPLLQSPALLGRTLGPIDDTPASPLTVVLSHALWTQHFGGDTAIVGRVISVDGQNGTQRPAIIIGVMPRAFDFPRGADLWAPMTPLLGATSDGIQNRGLDAMYGLGRLRPQATAQEGQRELTRLFPQVNPENFPQATAVVTPLVSHLLGPSRAAIWAIFGLALLVWLLACANVSGLLLVQWSRRRNEMAIRRALGASTRQIVVQWLLQACLMTGGAALVAVAVAEGTRRIVMALAGSTVPRLQDATLGTPVLLFGLLISAAAVLLAGAPPAWHAARATPMEVLKQHVGRTRSRTQRWLVAAELIVAIVTLAMAGRLVRAVLDLDRLDLGFQPGGVLTMELQPQHVEWPRYFDELLTRTRALPGVAAAGAISLRPLRYEAIGLDTTIVLEGQSLTDRAALHANPLLNYEAVTPGYFEAAGVPTRRGRVLDANDRADSPAVIVLGERAAAALWPGQNPIGQRLLFPEDVNRRDANGRPHWRTVVGVVKDVHYRGVTDVRLDLYVPATQTAEFVRDLVVRATGDPLAMVEPIRRLAREIDGGVRIPDVATLPRIVYDATRVWRLTRTIAIAFGALAMLIAGVGLYALLAHAVLARRYELAVRAALGARPAQLSRLVLREALTLAALASVVGLIAAVPATTLLATLDVSHTGTDLPALITVVVLLLSAALVAALLPAVRAAHAAPAALLRRD